MKIDEKERRKRREEDQREELVRLFEAIQRDINRILNSNAYYLLHVNEMEAIIGMRAMITRLIEQYEIKED
jgi:predicted component of type VI protein secretion system